MGNLVKTILSEIITGYWAENQRGRYFTYSTALYRYGAAKNTGTMYGTVISVRYLYGIVFFVRPYEIYG